MKSNAKPGPVSLGDAQSRNEEREFWTEPQLRRLLEKERFRAGRREIPFAFVVWKLLASDSMASWSKFAAVAASQLRLTDEIGVWESEVATLLTDTDGAGAEVACEKLRQRSELEGLSVTYDIYVYPDRITSRSNGNLTSTENNSNDDSAELESPVWIDASGMLSDEQVARFQSAQPIRSVDVWFEKPTRGAKRVFDILASLTALIVLSPLLALVALAVRLTSTGPVIFTQLREGRGGQIFKMYKFRTMVVNAEQLQEQLRVFSEQDGPAFKMTNDPRLTSIGRLLRKTCIDELPQLINILLGQMSIVGPRPLPVKESMGCKVWQRRRLDVTPGLTCSWQAEAARQVTFDDWMRLDLRYAKRVILLEDLRLIFRTAFTLVQAKASV